MIGVVIPARNEEEAIAATLASVRAQGSPCDLLVVDGGSRDRTVERAAPLARVHRASRAGRAAQMNEGARRVGGDAILFLHADTRLPDGAFRAIEEALRDGRVAGGAFRKRFDDGSIFHAGETLRGFLWLSVLRCLPGDRAIFVRRDLFETLGGFREEAPFEDLDLSRRMLDRGRLVLLPAEVVTSARRFRKEGPLRTYARLLGALALDRLGGAPSALRARSLWPPREAPGDRP